MKERKTGPGLFEFLSEDMSGTKGGTRILDGNYVFKLVDTHGLPLDIIVLELRDRGEGFDVVEFIKAAYKAGWKKKRIEWMLKSNPWVSTSLNT